MTCKFHWNLKRILNQRLVFEELNLVLLENFKNWLLNKKNILLIILMEL